MTFTVNYEALQNVYKKAFFSALKEADPLVKIRKYE